MSPDAIRARHGKERPSWHRRSLAILVTAGATLSACTSQQPRADRSEACNWSAARPPATVPEPARDVAAPLGQLTATVQGLRVTWPKDWTLLQLGDETAQCSWPTLQLTNHAVDIRESQCPESVPLRRNGVLLYVERIFEERSVSIARSADDADLVASADAACGPGRAATWAEGNAVFRASVMVGPQASPEDVGKLIGSFRGLAIEYPDVLDAAPWWHPAVTPPAPWDVLDREPKYVVAFAKGAGFPRDQIVLVPPKTDEDVVVIGRVETLAKSGSELELPPPAHVLLGGRRLTVDRTIVTVSGFVTPEVDRLLFVADSGPRLEGAVGPSLAEYGVDLRPVFMRLETPFRGSIVALDTRGRTLERFRYGSHSH